MAFNFIQNFKVQVYEILSSNRNITSIIDKIYLSIAQDAKYPFILIEVIKITNHTLHGQGIYNIEFEICVFARDKVQGVLSLLLNEITSTLTCAKFKLANHNIASLKSENVKFEQATDLITTKLKVNYLALAKEVR